MCHINLGKDKDINLYVTANIVHLKVPRLYPEPLICCSTGSFSLSVSISVESSDPGKNVSMLKYLDFLMDLGPKGY